MFIRLRTTNGLPVEGTMVIIDGEPNFTKTDAYIQFMKLVLRQIPVRYGKQDSEWQSYLDKICNTAEKLQDKRVRFTGSTLEEFEAYCKTVSKVMEKEVEPLEEWNLNIKKSDNLIPFIKKNFERGNNRAFYYEPDEDVELLLMDELMKQLSNTTHTLPMYREYKISQYLLSSGYHEEISNALNILISTAVYVINCSSTRERTCYSFDTQKVTNNIKITEAMVERIADLT